ncbi:MFS transporter [Amycolatopsis sp. PS_44_ISF1]|uniref:MFS transporter n=1 Tax=Amycolatopsis sp. PS_44_ISF1 TaxID=2974917 RepID=UPI0028DE5E51|nr:MFS transporter [Amycolatopsis sp. PS_44_ISF1]MDT8912292.1 MFS transporter [Amycolatopsis sp. PS_44_ISF1]
MPEGVASKAIPRSSWSPWRRLQATVLATATSEGLLLAALPLIAVSLTKDPRAVSLVNVAGKAPWLLLSLFAGLLIDRTRRTTALALACALQVGAALLLGLATAGSWLTLPLLMVVAFVIASSQVLGDGAGSALVPSLLPPDRFIAANARLQVIGRGAVQFVVPPLTGLLLALTPGLPAWTACAGALAGLALTRTIPSAATGTRGGRPLREIAEGLLALVSAPLLRSITITVALGSFASSAASAVLVLYATEILLLGPVGYGLLLACLAAGWLASSFVADRLVARFGAPRSMRAAQSITAAVPLLIAIAPPWPALVGALLAASSAATLIWNVCSQSIRQCFTPPPLLGRVLTSHRALAWGLTPLGALTGGLIAAAWSLRTVWLATAALQALTALIVWRTLSPKAFAAAEDRP